MLSWPKDSIADFIAFRAEHREELAQAARDFKENQKKLRQFAAIRRQQLKLDEQYRAKKKQVDLTLQNYKDKEAIYILQKDQLQNQCNQLSQQLNILTNAIQQKALTDKKRKDQLSAQLENLQLQIASQRKRRQLQQKDFVQTQKQLQAEFETLQRAIARKKAGLEAARKGKEQLSSLKSQFEIATDEERRLMGALRTVEADIAVKNNQLETVKSRSSKTKTNMSLTASEKISLLFAELEAIITQSEQQSIADWLEAKEHSYIDMLRKHCGKDFQVQQISLRDLLKETRKELQQVSNVNFISPQFLAKTGFPFGLSIGQRQQKIISKQTEIGELQATLASMDEQHNLLRRRIEQMDAQIASKQQK